MSANIETDVSREKIFACLTRYREKMWQNNKQILDSEISKCHIDKESGKPRDISTILYHLWGGGPALRALQADLHKVSDIYKHIPDGTTPIEDHELQTRVFTKLELSLNQLIAESYRPIAIPEEIKILATLTGGIVGPGFPMLQETTIVTALVAVVAEGKPAEDLSRSTGLLLEDGWELLVGFQTGGSGHEGASHVVYGKCTGDPNYSEFKEIGWMYVITYSFDQIDVYGNLVDYIEGYTEGYSEIWED